MQEQRATPTDDICPACGTGEPLAILYGLPSNDAFENAERLGYVLGGCIVMDESPRWECRKCANQWGTVEA